MLFAVANQKAPKKEEVIPPPLTPVWTITANKSQVGLNDTVNFTIRGANVPADHSFRYTIYEEEYPPRSDGSAGEGQKLSGPISLRNGLVSLSFTTLNIPSAFPERRVRIELSSGAEGSLILPVIGPKLVDKLTFLATREMFKVKKGSTTLGATLPKVSNVSTSSMLLKEFGSDGRTWVTYDQMNWIHSNEYNSWKRGDAYPYYSMDIWVYVPLMYANTSLYEIVISTGASWFAATQVIGQVYSGVLTNNLSAQDKAHTHWVRFRVHRDIPESQVYANQSVSISIHRK